MFGLKRILGIGYQPELIVDFSKLPILPRDTVSIKEHKPAGTGQMTLKKESFLLLQMPAHVPYMKYRDQHLNEPLGDALILDAFIDLLKQSTKPWEEVIYKMFGIIQGQIFFFGTTYLAEDGREVVPYLNVNTDTPAFRYACPIKDTIRWDFPIYSCELV